MNVISYAKKDFFSENDRDEDGLSVFFGGKENSIVKGHRHGPYTHDYYDVNYIKRGSMILYVNGEAVQMEENTLFVVPPYTVVEQKYTGEDNALLYVNVSGSTAERLFSELGFSKNAIAFPVPLTGQSAKTFENIVNTLPMYTNYSLYGESTQKIAYVTKVAKETARENQLFCIGYFYQFIAELTQLHSLAAVRRKAKDAPTDYVTETIKYIESQYRQRISVELIANHLGITRNYLHSLFRQSTGISVQEFIIRTRIGIACDLLKHQDIPIKIVAASVGYEPVAFGHAFKNAVGICAKEYRARHKNPDNT